VDDNTIKLAFGKALRKLREQAGLTQESLAELAGVHRTYMGDVERGERNVAIVNMVRMSQALGLPLSRVVREMEKHL
jgi:transcriptional regulator with XRE-family HTH domain